MGHLTGRDFGADLAGAEAYCAALGRSVLFNGDRPALPRCDSGKWGDPQAWQGASFADCGCTMRSSPMARCPYATRSAARPMVIGEGPTAGRYIVLTLDRQDLLEGVTVDGIDLSPSLHRDLTEEEDHSLTWAPEAP